MTARVSEPPQCHNPAVAEAIRLCKGETLTIGPIGYINRDGEKVFNCECCTEPRASESCMGAVWVDTAERRYTAAICSRCFYHFWWMPEPD